MESSSTNLMATASCRFMKLTQNCKISRNSQRFHSCARAIRNGKIDFVNDKPVVGGRFNLWSPDFFDVQGLVKALQTVPNLTDRSSSYGYSVIPVHAWSHNVSDVKAAADLLRADGRFDIVKPTELLARVNKYVKKQK